MTIDDAIKLLYKYRHIDDDLCIEDVNAALELASEALKRIHLQREHPKRHFNTLLSGEDPE